MGGRKMEDEEVLDLFSRLICQKQPDDESPCKLPTPSEKTDATTFSGTRFIDLLTADAEEHDYDWLTTVPDTPNSPTKAGDCQSSNVASTNISKFRSDALLKLSRFAVPESESIYSTRPDRTSSAARFSLPSLDLCFTEISNNDKTSFVALSPSSPGRCASGVSDSRKASAMSSRAVQSPSSTPARTQKALTSNSSKTSALSSRAVPSQSSTPTRTRQPLTPKTDKPKPLQNSQPSAPTERPRTPFANSRVDQSSSQASAQTRDEANYLAAGLASCPSSPSPYYQAMMVQHIDMPPNLRTKPSDRDSPAHRRQGAAMENLDYATSSPSSSKSRQPSSPTVRGSSSHSQLNSNKREVKNLNSVPSSPLISKNKQSSSPNVRGKFQGNSPHSQLSSKNRLVKPLNSVPSSPLSLKSKQSSSPNVRDRLQGSSPYSQLSSNKREAKSLNSVPSSPLSLKSKHSSSPNIRDRSQGSSPYAQLSSNNRVTKNLNSVPSSPLSVKSKQSSSPNVRDRFQGSSPYAQLSSNNGTVKSLNSVTSSPLNIKSKQSSSTNVRNSSHSQSNNNRELKSLKSATSSPFHPKSRQPSSPDIRDRFQGNSSYSQLNSNNHEAKSLNYGASSPLSSKSRQPSSPDVRNRFQFNSSYSKSSNNYNREAEPAEKKQMASEAAIWKSPEPISPTESNGFGRPVAKESTDTALEHTEIQPTKGIVRVASFSPSSILASTVKRLSSRFSDWAAVKAPPSTDDSGMPAVTSETDSNSAGVASRFSGRAAVKAPLSTDDSGMPVVTSETNNSSVGVASKPSMDRTMSKLNDSLILSRYDSMLRREDSRNVNWLFSDDDSEMLVVTSETDNSSVGVASKPSMGRTVSRLNDSIILARYDSMLRREDSRNVNWLCNDDDMSDQGSIFDHQFEPLPEPYVLD